MTTSPRIPCPQCGAELRLPDRKLLGKTGKCPKCSHRFLLQESEEAEQATPAETSIADPVPPANFGVQPIASPPPAVSPAVPTEPAFDFAALDPDPSSARIARI